MAYFSANVSLAPIPKDFFEPCPEEDAEPEASFELTAFNELLDIRLETSNISLVSWPLNTIETLPEIWNIKSETSLRKNQTKLQLNTKGLPSGKSFSITAS